MTPVEAGRHSLPGC